MITVSLVPAFQDNYVYILEAENGAVAVVDPGDARPVIAALEVRNLKPDMILITHYHWDHVNGVLDMLAWHDCPVIGSDRDKSAEDSPAKSKHDIPFARVLSEGDHFTFGDEEVRIFDTPGHTPEHISFYFPESSFVLTGDALFAMGCGRILDGTAEELYTSLQKFAALPDETLIYCGHEYTLSNAKFCLKHDPENEALQKRFVEVKALRETNRPTLPSTIGAEKETNVFLRAENAAEFKHLRNLKDKA